MGLEHKDTMENVFSTQGGHPRGGKISIHQAQHGSIFKGEMVLDSLLFQDLKGNYPKLRADPYSPRENLRPLPANSLCRAATNFSRILSFCEGKQVRGGQKNSVESFQKKIGHLPK